MPTTFSHLPTLPKTRNTVPPSVYPLSITTHILSAAVPRPNTSVEANTAADACGLATAARGVAADNVRAAGATAGPLVAGYPERREGACWAASGGEGTGVAFTNVVLAVCVGVEVYLACGSEGRSCGGDEESGELHFGLVWNWDFQTRVLWLLSGLPCCS